MVNLAIDDALLHERITGRRVHPASGRSYHVKFNPPKVENVDDITGDALIQRSDDKPENVERRLATFHKQTQPVIEYYAAQGKVVNVNGAAPMSKVWEEVREAVFSPGKVAARA